MRPVSSRFLSAITGSHRQVLVARVLETYQEGTNPTGIDMLVHDGELTFSAGSDVRGRLELTVDGRTDWPRDPYSLLAPYGNELFISRGIDFGDGSTELVSQGYFKITEASQTGNPKYPIRLSAQDRMSGIIEARLEQPRQFTPGTTLNTIFTAMVTEVYPDATFEAVDDPTFLSSTITRSQIAEQDRYKFLFDICRSRGKILYWDYRGILVIKDVPNPIEPVLEVAGGSGGVLVESSRRLTREGMYNSVVATGEAPDEKTPVRGVARDMNPKSPTYWEGKFGKKPRFYHSPLLETDDQCVKAARTILLRSLGMPYSIDFTMVPNPAVEPFDTVKVQMGDNDELHVLEDVRLSLSVEGPVAAATRQQVNEEDIE